MLNEVAERMRGVNDGPTQISGITAIGIEPCVGFFAGTDARGRCAHDDRHSVGAIALARAAGRFDEAVGEQAAPRKAVVRQSQLASSTGSGCSSRPGHSPDPGVDGRGTEIIPAWRPERRSRSAASVAARAIPDRGAQCVGGDS